MTLPTMTDLLLTSEARRPYEVFVPGTERPWPDWQTCQHGKRIVSVLAHWSDDAPFVVTEGRVNSTQRFYREIHLDGTAARTPEGAVTTWEYGQHSRCPDCGGIDTLRTSQEAWADVTTCTTDGCAYESRRSIGD